MDQSKPRAQLRFKQVNQSNWLGGGCSRFLNTGYLLGSSQSGLSYYARRVPRYHLRQGVLDNLGIPLSYCNCERRQSNGWPRWAGRRFVSHRVFGLCNNWILALPPSRDLSSKPRVGLSDRGGSYDRCVHRVSLVECAPRANIHGRYRLTRNRNSFRRFSTVVGNSPAVANYRRPVCAGDTLGHNPGGELPFVR